MFSSTALIVRQDSSACNTTDEVLVYWHKHYESALNHVAGTPCQELDDLHICMHKHRSMITSAQTSWLQEVQQAIRKLKNGHASGEEGIPPELLNCALETISQVLFALFVCVIIIIVIILFIVVKT